MAKPVKVRAAEYMKRRKSQGFKTINKLVHVDDLDEVKKFVKQKYESRLKDLESG